MIKLYFLLFLKNKQSQIFENKYYKKKNYNIKDIFYNYLIKYLY